MIAPWNAMWTGEERYEIRRCRFAGNQLAIWQPQEPGNGQPIFAKPHIVRQRRSIAEWRCTVCGERTPTDDRWWFEHGQFADGWYMTTESPVHLHCAHQALAVCPHLRALKKRPYKFPDGFRVLASALKPEAITELFGIEPPKGAGPVIGQLKLAWPERLIKIKETS